MKRIGFVLLAIGFLTGAFFAVSEADHVNWTLFTPCASAMFAGLLLVRVGSRAASGETERHEEDMDILSASLQSLCQRLSDLNGAKEEVFVYDVHQRLDDELMEELDRFVTARESMIPRLGLEKYARVMTSFAGAERMINRAWSASADGYVDEVWKSLGLAQNEMTRALDSLAEFRTELAENN